VARAIIEVLSTQAPQHACRELAAQFESATGHKVNAQFAGTLNLQKRLAAGEAVDLVVMAAAAIEEQVRAGRVVGGSRVDLAKSGVGVAVKKGAPRPDIGSPESFRKALLAAKSIGYSTGPSGDYMSGLFEKLRVAREIEDKLRRAPSGVFVAALIESGEAEIGFQQTSELVHFRGIDYVGPLPDALQHMTVFSAGIHVGAKQADAARALVRFLTAPAAATVIRRHGLEPV
jgi:molybdate transport system substrate-binding protein